ncbi:hypothetical protein RHMOL_Rhmol02G0141400 [Rhododendron molle]|uniref:Uncharacterized protein n=1 Tax=Rhododendron molle TaxID=49168 RepID=A0ACC0PRP6_RHOML|nr:hypothetical protein RHMOL_Rhmol02G0141400 [Rhododendron molle]
MNTIAASNPLGGGFVKNRSDPVVGKSGGFQTFLPLQIPLVDPFSRLFTRANREREDKQTKRSKTEEVKEWYLEENIGVGEEGGCRSSASE